MSKHRGYIQLADPIPVEPIVEAMKRGEEFFHVKGIGDVSISSTRLMTYTKGTTCVTCGIQASFFIFEKQKKMGGRGHLNLYVDRGKDGLTMMTSDHIIAKSRGGARNGLENRQPMCCTCNQKKGNLLPGEVAPPKKLRNKKNPFGIKVCLKKFLELPIHFKRGMPLETFYKQRALRLYNLLKLEHLLSEEERFVFRNSGLV